MVSGSGVPPAEDTLDKPTRLVPTKHNREVFTPRAAAIAGSVAKRDCGAPLHRNFFQLTWREECDPLAVWREKSIAGLIGARKQGGLQLVQRADVQVRLLVGSLGNHGKPLAIRRNNRSGPINKGRAQA